MRRRGLIGPIMLVGMALALLLGGAVFYEDVHVGVIYPGVQTGGQKLGDLTREQAAARLSRTLDAVSSRQVIVQGAGRRWATTFTDLGLHYDIAGTVNAAYAIGRPPGSLFRLGAQFLAPMAIPEVPPNYTVDDTKLTSFVHALAGAIDRPVRDAGVQLTGARLAVTPAQGGLVLDQADTIAQLRSRISQLSTAPVTLNVTSTSPVTGNGDVAAAVAQARRWVSTNLVLETPIGTTTMTQAQIATLIRLSQVDGKGPLTARLDAAALRGMLAPLAAELEQPADNASFAIQDGALVVAKPGQEGRSLDLDAGVAAVSAAIEAGQGVVRLPVRVVHPDLYSLEDVAAIQQQVGQLAGQPVTLQALDKTWTLSPTDLSALLRLGIAQQDGHQRLTLAVRADAGAALMQQIAAEVDQPAQNAHFQWQNSTLTLAAPSKNGRTVDQVAATKALFDAMAGPSRAVLLPVTVVPPEVSGDNPAALGIKDLVATGTSNFAGSPADRLQNIERGAQLIDGVVIAPGQVFSFDDTVGDISVAHGFTTGLVILGHQTQEGIGGGICQVSTTLFRAAFWAGLPIVERHDHAYAVPYYTQGGYPEGFDATIYSPQLDLKFKNDTSGYLLVQTHLDVATSMLTVSLYGTKTGRVVQLTPGPITNRVPHPADVRRPDPSLPKGVVKQVDWAHDGFDTWIKRTITVNGAVTGADVFSSHLQAWQAIYLVGTGPAAGKA